MAFSGGALELAARLRQEGIQLEVTPLAEDEVAVAEELPHLVAESPVSVIWLVVARNRELLQESRRLGVFGILTREDEPWSTALILETAARADFASRGYPEIKG